MIDWTEGDRVTRRNVRAFAHKKRDQFEADPPATREPIDEVIDQIEAFIPLDEPDEEDISGRVEVDVLEEIHARLNDLADDVERGTGD